MKKIILVLVLVLVSVSVYSQDKFEFNEKGLTEFVVVEIDSLSKKQLYEKSINWIKETYKSADDVIKMTIENEKIKINGFEKNAMSMGSAYFDVKYTIEISFKDNKYRFKPLNLEQLYSTGWLEVDCSNNKLYYKKNGKERKHIISQLTEIPAIFNRLNESLKNYLLKNSGKIVNTDDGW